MSSGVGHMKRDSRLPGGLANLGDTVLVVDRDGTDLGLMIVAEAQKRASEQGAELFVIARTTNTTVVRIVDVRKWKTE